MLTHLSIRNLTLVDTLDLELAPGLTVLTGETGAGKSILLDAIGLSLGDRADADKIRQGQDKAEVSAQFDLTGRPDILSWLEAEDLAQQNECILRRSLSREGRSRAFINDRAVTLQQLRSLGEQLINLHSQHEHQALMDTAHHRWLLDHFGQLQSLVIPVREAFTRWQQLTQEYQRVCAQADELNARYQLLSYQVEEFDQLAVQPGELERLELQQKQLTHADAFNQYCQNVVDICQADKGLRDRLHRAIQLLNQVPLQNNAVKEAQALLQSAQINIEEASSELIHALDANHHLDGDLPSIERRLTALFEMARKHRVKPHELLNLHQRLSDELQQLKSGDEQLAGLQSAIAQALITYESASQALSQARQQVAQVLSSQVNNQLAHLSLGHAQFSLAFNSLAAPSLQGAEQVEFLISTIPGAPPKPLAKIASGGELSRISLAIAVVTAKAAKPSTLIFDEVDVGIGGETGDVVGRLLRELGESGQVLCVTHLAQVASKAHQHLKVSKNLLSEGAYSDIAPLVGENKVLEIARMMGGQVQSVQSLAHAREMLERL
ncbi:MAG TPA: DNA repair protein RecN [Cellvibrionaceae bacterium]